MSQKRISLAKITFILLSENDEDEMLLQKSLLHSGKKRNHNRFVSMEFVRIN